MRYPRKTKALLTRNSKISEEDNCSLGLSGSALGEHPVRERRCAVACCASLVVPHRSSDVQVCPRHGLLIRLVAFVNELLQEQRSRDGATLAHARVLHVGDRAGHLLPVRLCFLKRHAPHLLASCVCGLCNRCRHRIVRGPQACDLVAQGDHARASERRHIDDACGAALRLRVMQRIRECQPPLCILWWRNACPAGEMNGLKDGNSPWNAPCC